MIRQPLACFLSLLLATGAFAATIIFPRDAVAQHPYQPHNLRH
jgi:hypothetical protein